MPYEIHLVGDIPLGGANSVMRTLCSALPGLRRVPDGRPCEPIDATVRSTESDTPTDVSTAEPDCAFANWPSSSHHAFRRLKDEEVVSSTARLQLNICPNFFSNQQEQGRDHSLGHLSNTTVLSELLNFFTNKDLSEIAIQVEVSMVALAALSGKDQQVPHARIRQISRLLDAIPVQATLLLHLCCLDGASYQITPADMTRMVRLTNELEQLSSRPVDLVHMPVPLKHEDDGFFRPLSTLADDRRVEICLGLVHLSDGVEGARRRLLLAHRHLDRFSIAARCGLGKRTPESIPGFLAMHAEIARSNPSDVPANV